MKDKYFKKRRWLLLLLLGGGIMLLFLWQVDGSFHWTGAESKLLLDFGGGQRRMFAGEADGKTTILLALYSSAQYGKFDLKYYIDSAGNTDIQAIDGQIDRGGKSWYFYLNQQKISEADLNRIIIRHGDFIEARLE